MCIKCGNDIFCYCGQKNKDQTTSRSPDESPGCTFSGAETDTKIILKSSDEAAKYVENISGWVDRHGRFYGTAEDQARWSGCTHIECDECGSIRERNSYCRPCHEKKTIKKFNALEKRQWDEKTPLYLDNTDEYFFDYESLLEYIDEHRLKLNKMRLVLCRPVKMITVDEDYFLEQMHEDAELPAEVATALEALNTAILDAETITWEPDKYAAIVEL